MHRYVQKDIQGTTEPQFRNSHSRTSGTVTLYLPVSTFVGMRTRYAVTVR